MNSSKPRTASTSTSKTKPIRLLVWLWVALLGPPSMVFGADAGGALAPGDRFRDCPFCPQMVVVPAGLFVMGSFSSMCIRGEPSYWDFRRRVNGFPQHRVRIAKPLAVGVYEVTLNEYNACEREFGCSIFMGDSVDFGNHPIFLRWNEVQEYVAWLSEKTGKTYRLLSESEWEYVARAGTTTPYHFGATISADRAHYGYRSNGGYWHSVVPVGQFPANRFGLHDVHGNVREWVQDCWNERYDGAPRDGSAWESGDCEMRVLRGGSFLDDPRNLGAACREGTGSGNGGIRVARTLTP